MSCAARHSGLRFPPCPVEPAGSTPLRNPYGLPQRAEPLRTRGHVPLRDRPPSRRLGACAFVSVRDTVGVVELGRERTGDGGGPSVGRSPTQDELPMARTTMKIASMKAGKYDTKRDGREAGAGAGAAGGAERAGRSAGAGTNISHGRSSSAARARSASSGLTSTSSGEIWATVTTFAISRRPCGSLPWAHRSGGARLVRTRRGVRAA